MAKIRIADHHADVRRSVSTSSGNPFRASQHISASRVAAGLSLSVRTVRSYSARVLEKMRLQSNADLADDAVRSRLLE